MGKYNLLHLNTFVLTFFAYSFFHASRKTFSNIKKTMIEEWTAQPYFLNETVSRYAPVSDPLRHYFPEQTWNQHKTFKSYNSAVDFAGTLDTLFLCFYSLGLYISGFLGDRFNLRYVLSFGMISSAVCVVMFGSVSYWLGIYNVFWYATWWSLCGLLQSTGWPTVVAVMGHWFGKGSRGLILGLWSSCASVGNIIGSLMVGQFINYGFDVAVFLSGALLFAGGIVVWFGLIPSPVDVGLEEPREDDGMDDVEPLVVNDDDDDQDKDAVADEHRSPDDSTTAATTSVAPSKQAVGFLQALRLPGVVPYSLAYACLKLVNYSFFFWLPLYLSNRFGWSQSVSDQLSSWYDVGGIISVVGAGLLSDRYGGRGIVCSVMMAVSLPSLYFYYSLAPKNQIFNSILMGNLGFWIGGVANLISAAISADLGRQPALAGNTEALATVTGIVDGTGSVGAALGQILVPLLQTNLGWAFVFYIFMLFSLLTIVCISPICWKELKQVRRHLPTCCGRLRAASDYRHYDRTSASHHSSEVINE